MKKSQKMVTVAATVVLILVFVAAIVLFIMETAENGWAVDKADVLKFVFEDSSWIAIRPSGTEPKIKVYYSVKGENKDDAQKVLEARQGVINSIINA